MNIAYDLAMNAGVLAALNYTGTSDKIFDLTGNSAVGNAVAGAIVSNVTKYGSHLLYSYGIYQAPPSVNVSGSLNELVENVLYDSVAMYAIDQFGVVDQLDGVLPGTDLLSVAVKQAVVMTAADFAVETARKTGLLNESSRLISGLESKIESLY